MIDIDLVGAKLNIETHAFRKRVHVTFDTGASIISLILGEDDAKALERQLEITLYDDLYHREVLEEKVINLELQLEQLKDELDAEREYNEILKRKLA